MGLKQLILVNDVETDQDRKGLIVGSRDVPASTQGLKDSVVVAQKVMDTVKNVDCILCSDLARVSRILHHLRVNAKYRVIVKITDSLRERDMGVLNCNSMKMVGGFQSDLFQHSRICAEGGETIAQCSERITSTIKSYLSKYDGTIVAVSHSLACNIAFNSLLGRSVTEVYPFWLKKGSYAIMTMEDDLSPWLTFQEAFNVLDNRPYSIRDIEDEFNEVSNISSPSTQEDS